MGSELQSILALVIVALAAVWLVRRALVKHRRGGSCGDDCGAISPEIRRLRARLKRRR